MDFGDIHTQLKTAESIFAASLGDFRHFGFLVGGYFNTTIEG